MDIPDKKTIDNSGKKSINISDKKSNDTIGFH